MYLIKKITHFLLFASLVLLLPVCTGNPSQEKNEEIPTDTLVSDSTQATSDKKNEVPTPEDRKFNDLARFISGLPPEEGSEFAELSKNPAWVSFAQKTETQWKNIDANKLPKMIQWRNQELKEANQAKGLLFYPFSGPDFMHASIFFPEAKTIVMIGLEPIGNLPNFEKITEKSVAGYFNGIQRALYSILNVSFFRTISMAEDFTGKVVSDIDGTLPILMFFITRTNHRLLYYEKVAINPEGKLVPAEEIKSDTTYYGTKIAFQRNDKPEERKTLYYFAGNLQNTPYVARSGLSAGGLEQRTDFRKYLESLNISTTYIKSASYLMHRDTFSILRKLILSKSKHYLQDDSGIPLRFFDKEKWALTFYGSYYSPIALFKERYQADLRQIYQVGEGIRPLPFGIGYQYQAGTSNLMLATKHE